jgi:hypothetical protein
MSVEHSRGAFVVLPPAIGYLLLAMRFARQFWLPNSGFLTICHLSFVMRFASLGRRKRRSMKVETY